MRTRPPPVLGAAVLDTQAGLRRLGRGRTGLGLERLGLGRAGLGRVGLGGASAVASVDGLAPRSMVAARAWADTFMA